MENRDLLKGRRQGNGKEVLGERMGTNSCSESFLEMPHMGFWLLLTTCSRKYVTGINAACRCGLSNINFFLYKHCALSGQSCIMFIQCSQVDCA